MQFAKYIQIGSSLHVEKILMRFDKFLKINIWLMISKFEVCRINLNFFTSYTKKFSHF